MAKIRLIKRRIKSAKNISQMTKAMEMVAASKMKKAQEKAVEGKPYAQKIYEAVFQLASKTEREHHPLLSSGNCEGRYLYIIISTNKGLCGSLNSNLFRKLILTIKDKKNIDFVTLGKKGRTFIARGKKELIADFSQNGDFSDFVPALTKLVVDGFVNNRYRQVSLFYNTFINALRQEPTEKIILPLVAEELEEKKGYKKTLDFVEFLIEPDIDQVLSALLPHYLENQIRSAIYEAEASEHSARAIAMKNASDAASDLIDSLTLLFNKARQEQITYEIADIVTAREAVEV